MKPNRHLIALALLLAAAAAHGESRLNAAIVRIDAEGHHYLYAAEKIEPGDDIVFQTPGQDASPACCAKRSWKSARLAPADPVAIDFGTGDKLYRYRLEERGGRRQAKPFVGIAASGKAVSAGPAGNGGVRISGGDGTQELALCTSPEGVHLVGQAGGKAAIHLYLYLGVVIEHPTCPGDIAN